MEVLSIYAIGSTGSGKHLFFDTLNIKFRDQDGITKFHTSNYSYKGKEYKTILYFITGSFSDPALLPSGRSYCDAVLFLVNPLTTGVFFQVDRAIQEVSNAHPNALIVLIMQNIFENLDDLEPMMQEIAISNGEIFFDLEQKYNIKLCSLNYNQTEMNSLESGDPMIQFKFFKLFNDAYYDIINECIERIMNPNMVLPIRIF